MNKYRKIIKKDLAAINKSGKTLKDVYGVIFSHTGLNAYERLVDFEIEKVTYDEQDLEIRAFAAYLKHTFPDASGGYIGIDLNNSPDFLTAFWGVLMSGNKPYFVNSFYPAELRVKLLKRLGVRLVITEAGGYEDFTAVSVSDFDKNCPKITDWLWADEFALSSALTGLEAKICVYDGEAVVNQMYNTDSAVKANNWLMGDYKKNIKVALILPLFHIFGIMACYFWFAFFGRTMVFFKDISPDTVRGTINRHGVTHIFAPPALFHKLYKGIMNGVSQESERRQRKFKTGLRFAAFLQNLFPALGVAVSKRLFKEVLSSAFGVSPRFMISGGAHIDGDALKTINCIGYPLFNGYGTTETAIAGANLDKKISRRTDGSIGSPFGGVSYSYGADGTLTVSGESACKKIITLAGSEESVQGSVQTNDLVKTENGRLFIAGRKSDLFIGEDGENISPDTIQNQLRVKTANRFCVLELQGKLCIVLEYGEKQPRPVIAAEIESVRAALAGITYGNRIDGIYATFRPIASPNAIKVSRAQLRRKIAEGEITLEDYRNPQGGGGADGAADDETMRLIIQAFKAAAAAAEDAEVSPSSDFFIDLGGASLDYLSLVSDLESMFNIQINLEKTQDLRTPERFYGYITELL